VLFKFLHFYIKLWPHYLLSHIYREEFIINGEYHQNHHHYRRFSKRYQKKQSIVKNFWIGAGLITIIFPIMPLMVVLLIFTTFLSFSFLDETE